MKRLVMALFVLVLVSCSPAAQAVQNVEVTRLVEVVETVIVPVEVEVTRLVEVTRIVEVTPAPPPLPEVFWELEGVGNVITETYQWGACRKAVWFWEAQGKDNMIVRIYAGNGDEAGLVNEIGPGQGQTLQALGGDSYYLEISGPVEGWKMRGECQD